MIASRNSKRRLVLASTVIIMILLSCDIMKGQDTVTGIQAEIDSQRPLLLHMIVNCGARNRATIYKYLLPWGNVISIVLVAVTASGESLQRDMPIDDPSPQKISLEPGESVSGTIDLRKSFRSLDSALAKGDVNLLWAYNAPRELGIAPHSGGWILLRRRK